MKPNCSYKEFANSVLQISKYYTRLVEVTKNKQLVGSTNEWVLDNFFMISEQEKVMKAELKGEGFTGVDPLRRAAVESLVGSFFEKTNYQIEKEAFFAFVNEYQQKNGDYLSFREVCLVPLIAKDLLIGKLSELCCSLQLRLDGKTQADALCAQIIKELEGDSGRTPALNALLQDSARLNDPNLMEPLCAKLKGQVEWYEEFQKLLNEALERQNSSINEVYQHEIDHSTKDNILMMNLFNSIKKISKWEMAEVFEHISYSEKCLMGEKAGMYDQMCDQTKADYRTQIIRKTTRKPLCGKRKQVCDEYTFVKQLVAKADKEKRHVGWDLFPPKKWKRRSRAYIWIVCLLTAILAAGIALKAGTHWAWLLLLVPLSQLVIDIFNQFLSTIHKPVSTFKLKFEKGIPDEFATMVIMPTILKSADKVNQMFDQLEVYYLSNINRAEVNSANSMQGNLFFTLVGDASAEKTEDMAWDEEVVNAGLQRIERLNRKYGDHIFNFVYRRRFYSEGEGCWLGMERKRGAILHFNDLLLGNLTEAQKQQYFRCQTIDTFPKHITFVITLDTDTELVLYSAQKLIGAMAHPLNRAVLNKAGSKVVSGYGIMQPRVNVDVEVTNKSRYAQLFAGLGGLDMYTTASFELYQDIFNEGSFCGKGIYDLGVFQQVLKGRFPENLILSHDLLEGCHIRCGLINDVELFDDSPSNYLDDAKRHHRWARGDWQIISWLGKKVRNEKGEKIKNEVNTIGKWKIFDNLRRSVLSLSIMLLLFYGFTVGRLNPLVYLLIALLVVMSPILFFIISQFTHLPRFNTRFKYYITLLRGIVVVIYRSFVSLAILPKEAWMYTDAIVRSLYRQAFSHRNLLNWVPSDEAAKSTKKDLGAYISKFWFNFVASALLATATWFFQFHLGAHPSIWVVLGAAFVIIAWVGAPFLMFFLGKRLPGDEKHLRAEELDEVRQWARVTWNFFDTLISEETHYLIPDNYQLNRYEKTDYKTSPTNIGYSLTAIISAHDLGFVTTGEALSRLGCVLDTVHKLDKWNGHLYNWYHVHSLEPLNPLFVSTADSGNFVACLYVVKGFARKIYTDEHQTTALRAEAENIISKVCRLIDYTDFSKLYNPVLDVFSIGFDCGENRLLAYHYNNFASEARLTSYMTIGKGDAPYKHWFCLDKTLIQFDKYKGVASWYGTLFEYFMPLIFLKTYKHTLMDETYSFAIMAQQAFINNIDPKLPWGISETAYHELDDSQNYKYRAFGVPYLKFQNTTPDRIVLSPYSSLLTIGVKDRDVYDNMQKFKQLGMFDKFGFFESYDEEDHECVRAHYAHHQGMILASLANYLEGNCIQEYFHTEKSMQAKETLLKEKVQIRPYIDIKVTKYKRYKYSKVRQESDAREYSTIAPVPEIGILSNGAYTVLMNDRGSGFSRYNNIYINRYRKISAEYYGIFLYIRNLENDHLWCNTYAPIGAMPSKYKVTFASDKICYRREDEGIETATEVTVVKDRNAELRKITFTNNTDHDVTLELTSYGEVVLGRRDADEAHRVFNGMGVFSDFDHNHQALIFSKRVREQRDTQHHVIHKLFLAKPNDLGFEYESSRLKFLGRNNSAQHAEIIESRQSLSGTLGTTLDPIMSMRRKVRIAAGEQETAYILIGFGKSREQVLRMADLFQDEISIKNAFEMATVYSNMRTAHSLLKGEQMYLYNSISKYLLQTASFGKNRTEELRRNTLAQSGLWRFGISGDLAILLLEIDSMDHAGYAKEVLQAYEYFKARSMHLDVVIINDDATDQHDILNRYIWDLANLEYLSFVKNPVGRVYVLNGKDLSPEERTLMRIVARVAFKTDCGMSLEKQILTMEAENQCYQDKLCYDTLKPLPTPTPNDLLFFNQYGGFTKDGKEYVVTQTKTPMPWINVLANKRFGCIVSSTMSGFSFAYNAQQFKLTSWSNDIVYDPASEMLLIQKQQFVPSQARHGQGYSIFTAEYPDYTVSIKVFVARDEQAKFYQISLHNKLQSLQTLRLDMLYKLVLGTNEESTARYLLSDWDSEHNTLKVRNVYHEVYRDAEVCLSATLPIDNIETDYPNRKSLTLNANIPASSDVTLAFVIGCKKQNEPLHQWTLDEITAEATKVEQYWDEELSTLQVKSPDPAFDLMLNRWYLYQVYSARLYARAGFYQVGGATGFRDQLQDVMSLLYSDPQYARKQIIDHAGHQFPEGDVLHWWHEDLKIGARTTFSDDYLWLIYVTYQYIKITGDNAILDEEITFAAADKLKPGEAERGMSFSHSDQKATLYEHLQLCINKALRQMGTHRLPLMGCGDWNDGMNRIGTEGKGESVWVAFFLVNILPKMAYLCNIKSDEAFAKTCTEAIAPLTQALQENAWDGAWFLRAFFDNGDSLGSRNNQECQIDLISQAWSILTNVAKPEQKESIFKEVETRLVNREHGIIQLLTPAFKHSKNDPGYIMNYPKGVRENGGQYTHGAMWYIMALLREGYTDQAYLYYTLINPIRRTETLPDVLKYKVEPYCICADIYSNRQHAGRGGWSWYTGSASWAYKTGIEEILGFTKHGNEITLCPQIPSGWDSFQVEYRYGSTHYGIHCHFKGNASKWSLKRLVLDGQEVPETAIQLTDDGAKHQSEWYFEPATEVVGK